MSPTYCTAWNSCLRNCPAALQQVWHGPKQVHAVKWMQGSMRGSSCHLACGQAVRVELLHGAGLTWGGMTSLRLSPTRMPWQDSRTHTCAMRLHY